ncbi:hypothetical protein [Haloarchaeobius sp. DT45]|uniref:hypothetical protein n=1 Tax=Haloarchaeobius sp. DT45 TaxID=3446116 RepID=UPI003F6D4971
MVTEGGNGTADSASCDECGAPVGLDDNFCTTCGAALSEAGRAAETSDWTWGLDAESDVAGTTDDDPTPASEGDSDSPTEPAAADRPSTDPDLADWQKRCPSCDAVLVSQAVRCTSCGASQPDVSSSGAVADAETGFDGDTASGSRDTSAAPWPHADARPDPTHGTTDTGDGEVQYERERARDRGRERTTESGGTQPDRVHEVTTAPDSARRRRPARRADHWIDEIGREPPAGGWGGKFARSNTRDRGQDVAQRGPRPFEPEPPNENWWLAVLLPAGLTLLGAFVGLSREPTLLAQGILPWTGDAYGVFEVAAALTPTLAPLALYLDRKYVHHESGWVPSKAFFLVAVPYLNVLVTALYLWKRDQYVETL